MTEITPQFLVSSELAGILREDVECMIALRWSSSLLNSWEPIIHDDALLRQRISNKVEDMMVSWGYGASDKHCPITSYVLNQDGGHGSLTWEEFSRRFPVSHRNMGKFIHAVFKELKAAMLSGYKIHGEWGEISPDDSMETITIKLK